MKRKVNTKDSMNSVLLVLLGSRSLVQQWWKTPNKAFDGKTPISLWKGTTKDQNEVKLYLIQAIMQEGS